MTNSYAHSHESPLVIRLEEVLSERAGHSYPHRKGWYEGQRAEGTRTERIFVEIRTSGFENEHGDSGIL